jgi:hypothetical protein
MEWRSAMIYAHSHPDRYRELASAILALVPMLEHREAIDDLRRLAARYEWLAQYLEEAKIAPTPEQKSPRAE